MRRRTRVPPVLSRGTGASCASHALSCPGRPPSPPPHGRIGVGDLVGTSRPDHGPRSSARTSTSSSSTRRTTASTTSTAAGAGRRPARRGHRRRHAAHDHPGRPERHALPVPPAGRREPHVPAAAAHLHGHRARHSRASSGTGRSSSTTSSSPRTRPAPRREVFAANGVLKDAPGLPGGCTRDLVHRFYQEQYQIDGGKQDRYVTGSDAVGLTMGQYDTWTCRSTSTCTRPARRTT